MMRCSQCGFDVQPERFNSESRLCEHCELQWARALIAKLPRTADGQIGVPGVVLFHEWNGKVVHGKVVIFVDTPKMYLAVDTCYVTPEAARGPVVERP